MNEAPVLITGGRVVDLRYDRLGKAWALEREIG